MNSFFDTPPHARRLCHCNYASKDGFALMVLLESSILINSSAWMLSALWNIRVWRNGLDKWTSSLWMCKYCETTFMKGAAVVQLTLAPSQLQGLKWTKKASALSGSCGFHNMNMAPGTQLEQRVSSYSNFRLFSFSSCLYLIQLLFLSRTITPLPPLSTPKISSEIFITNQW